MSLAVRRIIINSGKVLMGGLSVNMIAFAQGIIIARSMGPATYGIWGIILAYCGTVKSFLGFRTSEPLTRYLVEFKQAGDRHRLKLVIETSLATDFATSLASFLVILAAAPLAARLLAFDRSAVLACWIFAGSILFGFGEQTFYSVVRNQKGFNLLASLPLGTALFQIAAIASLFHFGRLSLLTLSITYFSASIVQSGIYLIVLRRNVRREFGFELGRPDFKGLWADRGILAGYWHFMRTTYLASMASSLLKNADMLVLGYFQAPTVVGIYRLAKSLATVIQSAAGSMSTVVYQDFNEMLSQRNRAGLIQGLRKLMRIWVPLVLAGAAFSVFVAEAAMTRVYGLAYAAAARPFQVLMIGMAVTMLLFWVQPMMLSSGFYRGYLGIILACTGFGLVIMGLAGKLGGPVHMAAAFSITWVLAHAAQFVFLSVQGERKTC